MDTLQNSRKAELLEDRINALGSIESYIGTFFSKRWVQKNVLNLTDAQIDEMQDEIGTDLDPDEVELMFQMEQMVLLEYQVLMKYRPR